MKQLLLILLLVSVLAVPALQAQEFETDFEQAQLRSNSESKPLLLIFSGSDWCKPCILLKNEVLSSEEFKEFANDNLVLVNLDFPMRKKNQLSSELTSQNEVLADRYNPSGAFPLVLLLNDDLTVKQQLSFQPHMEPANFIAQFHPTPINDQ